MTASPASLKNHPLAEEIRDRASLRLFMEHHVFAVWDFLALLKALQASLADAHHSGDPAVDGSGLAAINRIVAEEEADEAPDNPSGASRVSHLEIYLQAMNEVGADTGPIQRLMERLEAAEVGSLTSEDALRRLERLPIPQPSLRFLTNTFAMIHTGRASVMAAAFAHGRELLVPQLFQAILDRSLIPAQQAPGLHWYFRRHIAVDGDTHGPQSLALVQSLRRGSANEASLSEAAEQQALGARLALWNGIHQALLEARGKRQGCREIREHGQGESGL
ncbi:DUF3050 domain-containing protein [Synechococcus sp. RSCCF101]|uniref:DUF3050 domain-containing protein n=1 Tax=Synechococcus sp. RSCCF101 TaxID=2511069 RepID=UPI001781F7A9|nr:DUF3050 domain-containing protein [Synechococcus sp. RSCCF101]